MSGNEGETFDSDAEVNRGLGAFFGVLLGNVALIVVALILRRVTKSRGESSKGDLELKNGKRKVPADIEVGNPMYDDNIANTRTTERPRDSSGQVHVNDGFEEIDLDQDNTDRDDRLYEAPIGNEGEDKDRYASLASTGIETGSAEQPNKKLDEQPDNEPDEPLDKKPNNQPEEQLDEQPDDHPDEEADTQPDEHPNENYDEQGESSYENVDRKSKSATENHSEADVFY